MKLNGLLNELKNLLSRFASSDAPREVRHVGTEACWTFFHDYHVAHKVSYFPKPTCLSTLFSVFGGTSTLGLPAMVTVPQLTGI